MQWAGTAERYPLTHKKLARYLAAPHRLIFNVVYNNTNEVIGHCGLKIDPRNNSGLIFRILIGDENYQGRGLCPHILKLLLQIGFAEQGLHRIELNVYDFNTSAIKCYERVGFQKEGLLRENAKIYYEYWSAYRMAILSEEWR